MKAIAVFCTILLGAGNAPAQVDFELVKIATVPMKTAREILFHGNTAFVGQNLEGMTLLDVSSPRQPKVMKHYAPEKIQPMEMQVQSDNLLIVADRFRGLGIWDITRPDRMTSISELRQPGIATALDVYEDDGRRFAAVACGGEGLTLVDITDIKTPRQTARFRINTDYSRDVEVSGNAALVADNFDGGLKAVGLTAPRPPLFIKVAMRGFCDTLTLRDDLLIASYRNYGVRLFRVDTGAVNEATTPGLELLSSIVRSKNRVRKTAIDGDILALADDLSGIELYDISDTALPILAGEFRYRDPKTIAMACAFHKGLLYVASWDAGVIVFELKKRNQNPRRRR